MCARGPSGIPSAYQISSTTLHTAKKASEYVNMVEIKVPIPESLSYRFIKIRIIGKYVMSGEIMFVVESATRYAICVISGVIPKL